MPNETKEPQVKTQKAKRQLTPEEQAIFDKMMAAKNELKELRKKRAVERVERSKAEAASQWVIFRYIQKQLQAGNKEVAALVNAAGNACAAHDGYPEEKVQSDKKAIATFLKSNLKS